MSAKDLHTKSTTIAHQVYGIKAELQIVRPDPESAPLKNTIPNLGEERQLSEDLLILFDKHQWNASATVGPEDPMTDTIVPGGFIRKLGLNPLITKDPIAVNWTAPEVVDAGREGQGGKVFGQSRIHTIILRKAAANKTREWQPLPDDNIYFDPSYGAGPFATPTDYEDEMLDPGEKKKFSGGFGCVVGWRKIGNQRQLFYGAQKASSERSLILPE